MATAAATIPQNLIPVTREGHRLLRERLAALTTAGRAEASARVRDARADSGNPAENPELIHAFDAQEQLERRIAELESQLDRAQVIEGTSANGEVAVGTRVRVRRLGAGRRPLEYQIVSSVEADPGRGRLSIESPVGAALLGRRAGDTVEVAAPGGVVRFELMAVEDASAAHRNDECDSGAALAVNSMAA
jgi:transcription elongation factor GreA